MQAFLQKKIDDSFEKTATMALLPVFYAKQLHYSSLSNSIWGPSVGREARDSSYFISMTDNLVIGWPTPIFLSANTTSFLSHQIKVTPAQTKHHGVVVVKEASMVPLLLFLWRPMHVLATLSTHMDAQFATHAQYKSACRHLECI
jgi:hypothetical protein